MEVSQNAGTPESSILIVFSIINHPFLGTLILGTAQMVWGGMEFGFEIFKVDYGPSLDDDGHCLLSEVVRSNGRKRCCC